MELPVNSQDEERTLSSQIIEAVLKNDVPKLKALRESGESFSCCDRQGNTLLHLAIMGPTDRPTIDAFEYLLTLDEIPKDAINVRKNTPLFEAFIRDSQSFAVKLIQSGCDIHKPFKNGSTALHWAIQNEWIEVAELLIENGFSVDTPNTKLETPLNLACCHELIDEIWMLLFYGADPNMGFCFDICALGIVGAQIQEIFLDQLKEYPKNFNLMTFAVLMQRGDHSLFLKVLQEANKIVCNGFDVIDFCHKISSFEPELFRLFLQKFDDDACEVLVPWLHYVFACTERKDNLPTYIKNLFVLFESSLSGALVDELNYATSRKFELLCHVVESCAEYENTTDTLTKLLCFMLSLGVNLSSEAMNSIYFYYGYCDLFRMMLHMDIVESCEFKMNSVIPQIIYNVELTRNSIIKKIVDLGFKEENVYEIFSYFALPQSVRLFVEKSCNFKPSNALQNLHSLPVVPSLVELARNGLREHINNRFDIKNSRQFYTVLKTLPIAKIHKEILSYERRLYFLE